MDALQVEVHTVPNEIFGHQKEPQLPLQGLKHLRQFASIIFLRKLAFPRRLNNEAG